MKLLIATGIYPPQIGGPATYTKNLESVFRKLGHQVFVKKFGIENKLPPVVRHFWFFLKSIGAVLRSDYSLAFDAFSVGAPIVLASKTFGRKVVLRMGGDFLWESYLNRTGESVLLSEFYDTTLPKLNLKERIILKTIGWALRNADKVVFSTNWQKEIFVKHYFLKQEKIVVVENFYGPKEKDLPLENYDKKVFVSGVRNLKWKRGLLDKAFSTASLKDKTLFLDKETCDYECFLKKIKNSYAVILVSLADISPNTILDALRCNKPFILTKENGLYRLKDLAILVDPKNEDEISKKILWLANRDNYLSQKKKIENFNFVHSWEDIAKEFINVFESIK